MKLRHVVAMFVLVSLFSISTVGAVSGQSSATEIVESTNPSDASQEQIQTVQEWFYSEGDSLDDSTRNQVGSWLSSVSSGDSGSGSTTTTGDGSEVVDEADVPDEVVAEINDNIVLRSYDFNKEEGTVTLVLYAKDYTEEVAITDPRSTTGGAVGTVNEIGVTVNRQQTVETTFDVNYQSYSGYAIAWISGGVGEKTYVSTEAQSLVETLTWTMIPASALATALAIFVDGIVHIFVKTRKINNEFTNMIQYIK